MHVAVEEGRGIRSRPPVGQRSLPKRRLAGRRPWLIVGPGLTSFGVHLIALLGLAMMYVSVKAEPVRVAITLGEAVAAAHGLTPDEAAHQIAAVRETLEETGLALGLSGEINAASADAARKMLSECAALAPVLEAFGWQLDLAQITPFARWFPKNEAIARVYDTRFYLADLGTGAVDVSIDHAENTHLFWTTAQGALDAAERGEIKLIFPTRRNLERLALFASFAEARAQAEAIPVRTIMPQVVEQDGKPWLTILADAGYPVTGELLETVARG